MEKIAVNDLLSALNQKQSNLVVTNATQEFLAQQSKKIDQISKKKQVHLKRQSSYRATQQEMDKWIGIVKLNRQKDTLNFSKQQKDTARINFFPNKPISEFQQKIDSQLSKLKLQNQKEILKKEQKILQQLDPEEAKRRLTQARRHRTLVFNEQIKRRRIAKIKSKLFHKIKKRQKMREESKRVQGMNNQQKSDYLQKLTKKRIQQRISLRHKSKNKHIQNLLRFSKGDKNSVQQSINEVNQIRRQQMERLGQHTIEEMQDEYDNQNYKNEAIKDLEQEIMRIEKEQKQDHQTKGLDRMKFMRIAKEKEMNQEKREARRLIQQLKDKDDDAIEQEPLNQEQIQEQLGTFTKRTIGSNNKSSEDQSNLKAQHMQNNIKQFLKNSNQNQLIEGISIENLKEKYNTNRIELNISEAINKNKELFQNLENKAIEDNYIDFQKEKNQDYQNEIAPQQNKRIKGWGNWTGPNIKDKRIDPQLEIKIKLAKIDEIKRKRRDGEITNVIFKQAYNKNLKDYFAKTLPHNYKSAQQFDYLQDQIIGPEWNTLTQFKTNIKPKVITKVGQVIESIHLPKNLEGKQVNKYSM